MRVSKYNTGCNEKFKGYAAFLRRLALHDPTRVVTWSLAAYRSATEETKIINKLDYNRGVSGGDNMAPRMYLLNLQKLLSSDVIKAFKEKEN